MAHHCITTPTPVPPMAISCVSSRILMPKKQKLSTNYIMTNLTTGALKNIFWHYFYVLAIQSQIMMM